MYTNESQKNRSLLSDILCTQAIGMSIEISWGDASKTIQQKVTLTSNVGHLQIQYYESQCKSEKMFTHLVEGTPHIFSSEQLQASKVNRSQIKKIGKLIVLG